MWIRNIVVAAVIAMLLPLAAYASDCNSCCKKVNTCCKSSCNKCESKCDTCKPKCNTCAPKCNSCGTCNKCSKCGGCNKCDKCASKCNSCNKCSKPACEPCKKPACACMDWHPYCGCEEIDSLCISLSTCDCDGGTAGPLKLELHGNDGKTIATAQLDGPIEGSYNYVFKFDAPIKADSLKEAVIVNDTDDSATLTWFNVTGLGECGWSYTYFDHKCDGVTIGKDGCPRFVLF